ncbi:MAG TPA: phosphoribosyltransferase family protein [Rhizomicrobium sp.]|nr:phosphoribosyltransferase family protein [Rhizomicrobium sp.]
MAGHCGHLGHPASPRTLESDVDGHLGQHRRRLARDWRLGYEPQALARTRPTQSQGAMASAKARRRNVLGAFKVPDPGRIKGKRILLLDDVLTTGATVEACARALKRAGATRVHVLVLARVVKAADVLI